MITKIKSKDWGQAPQEFNKKDVISGKISYGTNAFWKFFLKELCKLAIYNIWDV